MRIVVLGAGVIGVTSAWYLSRAGHQVTVVDRQPAAAMETSFANAGEISPGYSTPWAAPGIPQKALRWMFQRHAPLILRASADRTRAGWMAQMLRNCTADAYEVNKSRMMRLAVYSRECLESLRTETGIRYEERTQGTLQLFRDEKQVKAVAKDIKVLKADGVAYEELDVDGCIAAEPGLAHSRHLLAGGLRLPGDETGDCHIFTQSLAALAAEQGVTFLYDTAIEALESGAGRIEAVRTSAGRLTADLFVVALGSHSPALVAPFGVRLPVHPVKGYSLTLPIVDAARAPVSTVMDETYKIAITRLGDRIRVGGLAELAGFDLSLSPRRRATLAKSVGELFGGAGDLDRATFWTGLRPMTPDGTPIIGATGVGNLWVNTGHGTLGWTMAAGSARVLADMIGGRTPDIQADDLSCERYLRKSRSARPALEPAAA
ncbi:D-amino acid dehydrogenase [Paracoccus sp. Z118]|uniref:D-amino acid dehydrogenase n=1 Tax=Paracoccus sp. Z118 TaxID=2851017 RepID=UPI001C2C99D5|nr:D-amino acid dehydrogenase [Paracoccus sp. Z118]MBV0891188.1 D-amino acid dehydrogenase [Paracoccus sp. Z118]